jgi:flagellar biosynthetic protein FliP
MVHRRGALFAGVGLLAVLMLASAAWPADVHLPGIDITLGSSAQPSAQVASALKIFLALTVLSLGPAILIAVTSFTRIIIVLSMLRHALGMQETPPNIVLISLALFLTLFVMMPVVKQVGEDAWRPFTKGELDAGQALDKAMVPLREFMIRQTREQDMALMVEISHSPVPQAAEEVSSVQLIPAFMLSELKSAFQIGFVIFLPFLLIDLLVSSVLMSMGMFMVPPVVISLPIKVLMFVLIDGWNLVMRSILGSFH